MRSTADPTNLKRQFHAEQEQRAKLCATLGTVLVAVATVFRGIGFYRMAAAVEHMNFAQMDDLNAVKETLTKVTRSLGAAGDTLLLGNTVLLVGGGLVTYAFMGGRFRQRWFLRCMLVFGLLLFWDPLLGTIFGLWCFWLLFSHRREASSVKQAIIIAE